MKNISKYLGAAVLLFATACSQTQENALYKPNQDDAKQIHFIQSSVEKEFAQSAKDGVIDLEIARTGNTGSYTVTLLNKGDNADLFDVPTEVTIPDGKYSVTIPVAVDLGSFIVGGSYKTSVYIKGRDAVAGDNGAQVSQYTDKVNLSASFELQWEPYYRETSSGEKIPQLATYYYSQYYTGADKGLEVDKAIGANIFRLHDWASGVYFKFILNADKTCTVPAQSIGYYNSTYNEYVFVSDMAVYTGDEAAYISNPCTFDGKDTFSFYLIYYVSAGYFGKGVEKLVFDSDPDTTAKVDISYEGIETTETGVSAPKLAFSPNDYTKYYKSTIVAGDITDNMTLMQEIRAEIIDGKNSSGVPIVTYYGDTESTWNIPKGNFTAVALPYDEQENPGDLFVERFTYDPMDEYSPKVRNFKFYAPQNDPMYSSYNTLVWELQASNAVQLKYLCVESTIMELLLEANKMSMEDLTENMGSSVNDSAIELIVSEDGMKTSFSPMAQGTEYTLGIMLYNAFGDKTFISTKASTKGRTAADFDSSKTQADFEGSFTATALVTGAGSKKEVSYRMDILRVNDTEMIIKGMSDMRDFSPEMRGYYDKSRHMLVIEPQAAGMYDGNYANLGFTDNISIYWGSAGMSIGYIGDTLYWTTSPYYSYSIRGYMFLLFNSPTPSSTSYLKEYVGSKTYTDISMKPIRTTKSASGEPIYKTVRANVTGLPNGMPATIYLMNDPIVQTKAAAKAAPVKAIGTAKPSKSLRTDLQLHTR